MGANKQRIDALEREVDQLHIVIGRLHDRIDALEAPRGGPVVRPQSLVERARSEFADRWGWLLEAVGP